MDENEIPDADDQSEPIRVPIQPEVKEPIPWGAILAGLWAVLLVIFSVQNAEDATVQFLGWSFDMPVALLVIVTALVTVVLTGLGLAYYRRRRRKEAKRQMEQRESEG